MKQKKPFHVMIIPTLGCPSKCSYCWSSEEGSPIMSIETVQEVVAWLKNFRDDPVTFTFHGGERCSREPISTEKPCPCSPWS